MVPGTVKKWSTFILRGQAINVVPYEHQEPLTPERVPHARRLNPQRYAYLKVTTYLF